MGPVKTTGLSAPARQESVRGGPGEKSGGPAKVPLQMTNCCCCFCCSYCCYTNRLEKRDCCVQTAASIHFSFQQQQQKKQKNFTSLRWIEFSIFVVVDAEYLRFVGVNGAIIYHYILFSYSGDV